MMTPKTYHIFSEAVEQGIEYGLNRAYKHTDTPDRDYMAECILRAVTNQVCEYFEFDNTKPNIQVFENRITKSGYNAKKGKGHRA